MATATPRSTAAARREAILDAAVAEFAARGLHGTAVESVAAGAGVSQPYVFRLFGTKKALFLATIDRVMDRLVASFSEAAQEAMRSGGDPLTAMGFAYITLLTNRDELLVHMQAFAACADPEVQELVRRRFGEVARLVLDLPGATEQVVHDFMAKGMLLNVVAAMDLLGVADEEEWARICIGAPPEMPKAQPRDEE